MGQIIRVRCENNDNTMELRIGQGIRDNNPDTILGDFPDARRESICAMIDAGKMWNYRRALALCRQCGSFTTVPLFETVGDDAVCVTGICECGHGIKTAVILSTDDEIGVTCPKCGGRIEMETIGFWD